MAATSGFSLRSRHLALACAAVLLVGIALLLARMSEKRRAPAATGMVRETTALREPALQTTLLEALATRTLAAQCTGNGRDRLRIAFRNLSKRELLVEIPAGLVFEAGGFRTVLLRPRVVPLPGSGTGETALVTAALQSSLPPHEITFSPIEDPVSQLAVFLPYLQKHPQVSQSAAQTATLALVENLPLSAFARFPLAAGPSPGTPETTAFQTDTRSIIEALQLLKEIGYPMERLALTADPQLKIEAMIDPLARAPAMRFYGITAAKEWDFWRSHLLEGPPGTRHYALHGIARYYPSTALRMLPKWALRYDLDPVYRLSAIRALAQTGTESALPVLKQLSLELSGDSTLSAEIAAAMRELDENLRNPSRFIPPVPYRMSDPEIRDRTLIP